MNMTVQDILTDSLGLIGAIAIDETPTATELANALRAANVMIDKWSTRELMLRSPAELTFTTTGNKASYTVATSGADITSSSILTVLGGYVTNSSIDYPLEAITKDLYDTFADKTVANLPEYIAYNPGATQQASRVGTLYLYPTPDTVYTVKVKVFTSLTEFSALADNVTFEPAYYEAIIYNLAVRLFRRYHAANVPVPDDIAAIAKESAQSIMNLNAKQSIAKYDFP